LIETTIKMNVFPEKRSELLQTLRSMIEAIRKEKGCMSCFFYQDLDNENIFRVIEEWTIQEELDSHLKSEIFGALIGMKSLLVEPADINIKVIAYKAGIEAVTKAREESRASGEKDKKEN
jgi:quinol monooxygenase YgiN